MSTTNHATFMEPDAAAKVLRDAIKRPEVPLTIADAAAQSGLPLRDADRGLQSLVKDYRGHLRVTDKGELLFVFPHRFTQPWKTTDALSAFFGKIGHALAGIGRFVVRAWLTIVLFAYVALFIAVLIAFIVASSSNNNNRSRGNVSGEFIFVVFRILGDALFWTFHPFSPISVHPSTAWGERRRAMPQKQTSGVPFYEKVNRYFFGPPKLPLDPLEKERKIVTEIRASRGRIGLADVMRVTGLPREEADPLMAKLMLDYDGDVFVSPDGGITYKFESLRKTADERASTAHVEPAWSKTPVMPPLTGNDGGANFMITALNAFNLIMALVALDSNLTLSKIGLMLHGVPLIKLPYDGVPIVLGIVPLIFSVALFALPLVRAALRPIKQQRVTHERARLAVMREVLTRVAAKQPVDDQLLVGAWTAAAGKPPESKELVHEVVRLGGDVENDAQGRVRYRFVDLETEAAALDEERATAQEDEAKVGKVVFASDR